MDIQNQNSGKLEKQYTRRIVSNSFLLLIRMLFVTFITLWTVRFVLEGLGVEGYGAFNAIAGIVLTGTFVIPVLATSIQRFYSYALGIDDEPMLQKLFSVSLNIILFLIAILVILLETVGLWYVNCHLVVPEALSPVVNTVYQLTILSFLTSLLLVPFTAVIFSHEDMGVYAVLSCVDCSLKCLLALAISLADSDRLVIYSGGLLTIAVLMLLLYAGFVLRRYPECRYHWVEFGDVYKRLLSFSGWTTYGAISGTAMIQGSVMVLNFFFGPLANAAFAVADNLYNAFNSLANSVVLSFRPAMTKVYAQGNNQVLNNLFNINNKLILYCLGAISLPVIFEIPFILKLWLGTASPEMVLYSRLFIAYTVCLVMHNPITTIIQSTGNIKKYFLLVETVMMSSVPLAIVLFRMGLPSYFLFVAFFFCCLMAHVLRLYCLKDVYSEFSCMDYVMNIALRGALVLGLAAALTWWLHSSLQNGFPGVVAIFLLSPSIVFLLTYIIGLSGGERRAVIDYIKKR